jgi:hypothetical protein
MRIASAAFVLLTMATDVAWSTCNVVNGQAYGDCANVTVRTEALPAFAARGFQEVTGIYKGAEVPSGATLVVKGIIENTTHVFNGGKLVVQGIVDQVVCDGGVIQVDGHASAVVMDGCTLRVSGIVDTARGTGTVSYRPGAVVNDIPYEKGFEGTAP